MTQPEAPAGTKACTVFKPNVRAGGRYGTQVQVTAAFFAEAASRHDGRLFVLGGLLDTIDFKFGSDVPADLTLVVLIQADSDDFSGDVRIRVYGPDGQDFGELRPTPCHVTKGAPSGFVIVTIPSRFHQPGRHSFVVRSGSGAPFSLPLTVKRVGLFSG